VQFLEALGRYRRGRLHQKVLSLLIHREGYDLAQVRLVGQQHDDTINTRRRAAVRRGTKLEGVEQAGKPRLCRFLGVTGNGEGLVHDVRPMVTDRTRRQFRAVAHDVVLIGIDRQRILRLERFEAALRHR
jgi:hypothetical protein